MSQPYSAARSVYFSARRDSTNSCLPSIRRGSSTSNGEVVTPGNRPSRLTWRASAAASSAFVRGVPVLAVGQDAFGSEGAGDGQHGQAEQPEFGAVGRGDGDAGAVDGQEHERHVAVPDERFHAVEPAGRSPVPP